jgi:PP-loop superfamily ATP-utilizing enzyme
MRAAIVRELKAVGYRYVTLDLQGYRLGSLNEGLLLTRT